MGRFGELEIKEKGGVVQTRWQVLDALCMGKRKIKRSFRVLLTLCVPVFSLD